MFEEFCERKDSVRAAQRGEATEMKNTQKILATANLATKNAALLEKLENEDLQQFCEEHNLDELDLEDMVKLDRNLVESKRTIGYDPSNFILYANKTSGGKKKKKDN